jgi:hypothetical protein
MITGDDVIYFDDFWHPGIEAIPYACTLLGVPKPKMYAFCWAQSVDQYDFTTEMLPWGIRHFEKGIGAILDGVFVANTQLAAMLVGQGLARNVHVVGLPFCSEEVMERMGVKRPPREDKVVFSSRWDHEKDPMFFLDVVWKVLQDRPNTKFVVCTSQKELRSNSPILLGALKNMQEKVGEDHLSVRTNLTKEQYYQELLTAKIQFNCALQDWVSFTLLEATVAGCYPIYPNFRSFPETFCNRTEYLYNHGDANQAVEMIKGILDQDEAVLWSEFQIYKRSWIYSRFDNTWARIAYHMGLIKEDFGSPYMGSQ